MKNKQNNQFYKGHYLIALYDREDSCVGVFDNIHDMSYSMERSCNTCSSSLSRFFSGYLNELVFKGKKVKPHLIDLD